MPVKHAIWPVSTGPASIPHSPLKCDRRYLGAITSRTATGTWGTDEAVQVLVLSMRIRGWIVGLGDFAFSVVALNWSPRIIAKVVSSTTSKESR